MRPPEGDRLDDAVDMFHDARWSCPGGKPLVSTEQLAYWLLVLEPWFRDEYFVPKRKPVTVPKRPRTRSKPTPAGTVTSGKVPARIRDAALCRDGRCCQRCGISLHGRDYSLQHRDARGMGGSKTKHTLANLVALCGTATTGCHGYVESQPIESDRLGWSVPNGATPEEWPVFRFGASWEQPGDEWVKAEPHPYQIEMGAVA
jgi:hypothetical protein